VNLRNLPIFLRIFIHRFSHDKITGKFKAFKKRKLGDHFRANKLAAWDLYKSAFICVICGFGLPERVIGDEICGERTFRHGLTPIFMDLFTE